MTVWITYICYALGLLICGMLGGNVFLLVFLLILFELIKIRVAIGG